MANRGAVDPERALIHESLIPLIVLCVCECPPWLAVGHRVGCTADCSRFAHLTHV